MAVGRMRAGHWLFVFWWRSVGAILGTRGSRAGYSLRLWITAWAVDLSALRALIAGAVLISPMIVPFVARPFCRFIDTFISEARRSSGRR